MPPELVAPFAYDGEVRVQQWLEKPQSWLPGERASHRGLYDERHLFEGIVATAQHPAPVPVPMTSAPCGACVDTGVHMEVDVGLIPAMFGLLDAALSLAPPPVVFPAPPPPRHRARPVR